MEEFMKFAFGAALLAAAFLTTGCASRQALVPLSDSAFDAPAARVGIAMTGIPKPDTFFPGADCLLCYATASLANKSLTNYTQTLSADDLGKIKQDMAKALTKKGMEAKVIDQPIALESLPDAKQSGTNIAKKDFTSYRSIHNIDKLVVIQMISVGYTRTYASYFPTSEPKASTNGLGYMVDLKSNVYDWYLPVTVTKASDGPWDEPAKFPGLTNAYYQALEATGDDFLKPFASTTGSPMATTAAVPASR
jgi:hypothetical protein